MAYSLATVLLTTALLLGACVFFYSRLTMQDPREPPQAPTPFPFVGHVLGLMRYKFNYHERLRYVTSNQPVEVGSRP